MGINEDVRGFINAIKSTREFNQLMQAKKYIEGNRSLRNNVFELNRRLEEIYSSNKSENIIEAKIAELNTQFGSLLKIPEVDKFLKAHKNFNELMFNTFKSINDAIETDLKF